jgi:hypothetical protein
MEASEAHRTSLANFTPDEIARKHWVHGHATVTHLALPRPFTQEITGSNPVGGIRRAPSRAHPSLAWRTRPWWPLVGPARLRTLEDDRISVLRSLER